MWQKHTRMVLWSTKKLDIDYSRMTMWKSKFHLSGGTKCYCSTLVQASFESATNYYKSVCLHKLNGSVIGACCKCKAGAGSWCSFTALHFRFFKPSPKVDDRTCTDKPQQWNAAKKFKGGPVLFADIMFVHHTFGKSKAEKEGIWMGKHKTYCACLTLCITTEEEIYISWTGLKYKQNTLTLTRLFRRNHSTQNLYRKVMMIMLIRYALTLIMQTMRLMLWSCKKHSAMFFVCYTTI